jgi:hypothetical protein
MSDKAPSFLTHHGVKGMHWGVREASSSGTSSVQDRGQNKSSTPLRPRPAQSGQTREQQLVARSATQAHTRVVAPALTKYAVQHPGIPKSNHDPVQELLEKANREAANRVEREAGKDFIRNLHPGIRLS